MRAEIQDYQSVSDFCQMQLHAIPHPPQCAHWGTFPPGEGFVFFFVKTDEISSKFNRFPLAFCAIWLYNDFI